MNWDELRAEYGSSVIGPKLLEAIATVVRSVIRKGYDPMTYGGVRRWEDGIEDLVQEVVEKVLLGEGQLDYIMAVARDAHDFVNLLSRQTRRMLARRRQRTVIDNLLERCREAFVNLGYSLSGAGAGGRYHRSGAEVRPATEEELRNAALAVAVVPRQAYSARDRAPAIYAEKVLHALLAAITDHLPGGIALGDLQRIFSEVLTDWLPGALTPFEGVERQDPEIGAEEMVLVAESVQGVLDHLSGDQRRLLALKLAGASDGEIAATFGVSRPTLANRKRTVFEVVQRELQSLSDGGRDSAVDALCLHLASDIHA